MEEAPTNMDDFALFLRDCFKEFPEAKGMSFDGWKSYARQVAEHMPNTKFEDDEPETNSPAPADAGRS